MSANLNDNNEVEIRCADVVHAISDYIDGEIDPGLQARMNAHFSGCAHCTAILDGTRNVLRLVGDGRIFELPTGFSDRLRVRIEAELLNS